MKGELKIKIGEEFKPAPQSKKLYHTYLALAILFGILTWYIPVLLFTPLEVKFGISILILAVLIFVAYWISRYYDTIAYKLTGDEMYFNETRTLVTFTANETFKESMETVVIHFIYFLSF